MAVASRFDPSALRLILITDGRGDPVRVERIVEQAVAGGVRCVQLREPQWSARAVWRCAERLGAVLARAQGLLLVNDRIDVALAGAAHGVQVGHRSLPPDVARRVLGDAPLLGYSAHEVADLDLAAAGRCDFALLSPIWPTSSKPGAPHLGTHRAGQMTSVARVPVVWLGGIDAARVAALAELPPMARPVGIAVRSAILDALDPGGAARELVHALAQALPPAAARSLP